MKIFREVTVDRDVKVYNAAGIEDIRETVCRILRESPARGHLPLGRQALVRDGEEWRDGMKVVHVGTLEPADDLKLATCEIVQEFAIGQPLAPLIITVRLGDGKPLWSENAQSDRLRRCHVCNRPYAPTEKLRSFRVEGYPAFLHLCEGCAQICLELRSESDVWKEIENG